ncbi:MAG: LysM peptidoglycan-binding domain-containing protein [Actinomycetota bacterium]|nr:LysM peptidoglycan-binding domain-containing protein [Actinomycetota bacterium]
MNYAHKIHRRREAGRYRRRRLGALFVAAIMALAFHAAGGAGADPEPVTYTVAPGDTLWDIAAANTAAWDDPRPKVELIRQANDLSGSTIRPGMQLEVPAA